MTDQQRMIRGYDHFMVQRHRQRYYERSGYYNFGYWEPPTAADGRPGLAPTTQRQACDALVDRLVAAIPEKQGRILDVACGMGGSTERLTRYYPPRSITAINISDAQLALAAERVPQATFRRMDATALEFPDATFDAILCVEAAFHFDTRAKFFAEALRVLKPGGTITLSDVLNRPWVRYAKPLTHVPEANLVHDVAEYRRRFSAAGFTAVVVEDKMDACLRSIAAAACAAGRAPSMPPIAWASCAWSRRSSPPRRPPPTTSARSRATCWYRARSRPAEARPPRRCCAAGWPSSPARPATPPSSSASRGRDAS